MKAYPLEAAGPVVAGVIAAEVARAGGHGVVLASPPGPASELVRRWLAPSLRVVSPDAGAVADVAGALAAGGAPGTLVEALAWRVTAEALGAAEGLVPIGCSNKTELLLDPGPLPARVLPLGDVWASTLHARLGQAALPPVLAHATPIEVAAVDGALVEYLERGAAPAGAFGRLGRLQRPVRDALDRSEVRRRGLLVPKLTPWAVGSDLAR
ncbi:MAG TPA: hypothetical protein VLH75_14770 [Longimicrobiales bacterium]|nr:hypothetical protein [Longimicrobiales bacterium]